MTRQSSIKEPLISASGAAPPRHADLGTDANHLPQVQEAPDLMRAATRGHLARADLDAARQTAERWAALLAERPAPLDLLIETALSEDRVDLARTLLSEAEASAGDSPAPAQGAAIRARIARADGDLQAAIAILVQAIELHPNSGALRALLAEVMVAAGTAGDARAVLTHLGQAPVNPLPADEDIDQDGTDSPDSRVG